MNSRGTLGVDRQALAALLDAPLAGGQPTAATDRALVAGDGPVKTFALEVNDLGALAAPDLLEEVARDSELGVAATEDPTLFVLRGEEVTLFVDVLNPRYWLVHTASGTAAAKPLIRRFVWARHEVDSCWFPLDFLVDVHDDGEPGWFKADFQGADLLPPDGVPDRRLRVQLEGESAFELLSTLRHDERYRTATAVTAIGARVRDRDLGGVDEILSFNGYFVARGTSFHLHVDFVTGTVDSYAALVAAVEDGHRLRWNGETGAGLSLDGDVCEITLSRPIPDMDRFLAGLFSCRDPFRLWAVPHRVTDDYVTAEVVDLHIGERFSMDITPTVLRLYLTEHVCGNTALRLLANLQHRYDATAAWNVERHPSLASG